VPTVDRRSRALARDRDVPIDDVAAGGSASVEQGGHCRAADPEVRIQDEVVLLREREHQTFYELDRELARMFRLLDVVVLHVRNDPHVARVLAQRVEEYWPAFGPCNTSCRDIFGGRGPRPGRTICARPGEPHDRLVRPENRRWQ